MEIYTVRDGVLLGFACQCPQHFGRKHFKAIDIRLRPVCKFFVTGKCNKKVKDEFEDLILAISNWGKCTKITSDKKTGGLICKHKFVKLENKL